MAPTFSNPATSRRLRRWAFGAPGCLVLLFMLAGCGPKKVDTGNIEVRSGATGEPAPQRRIFHSVPEEDRTDYGGSEGVFRIIPPAVINPRNLQYAEDPRIITIDFQQGFHGVQAQVIYEGEVIFNSRLRSNQDGFADSVNLRYGQPPVRVTLRIPSRGIDETFVIDPDKGRFLGIGFQGPQLMLNLQERTFFYPALDAVR